MRLVFRILAIVFLFSALLCVAKPPSVTVTWSNLDQYDTLLINGRVYVALGNEYYHPRDNLTLSYPKIKEGRIRDELDKSLIRGYIYPEPDISEWRRPVLPIPKDLEALPYIVCMYCDNRYYLPDIGYHSYLMTYVPVTFKMTSYLNLDIIWHCGLIRTLHILTKRSQRKRITYKKWSRLMTRFTDLIHFG